MHRLHDLPLAALFLLVVGGTAGLAIATASVAHRVGFVRERNREGAGMLYAYTTLVYAVLLGWTVFVVYQRYVDAEGAVWREANAAADLYQALDGLDPPIRDDLKAEVRGYLRLVVEREWPTLARGDTDDSASRALDVLESHIVTLRTAPDLASVRSAIGDRAADLTAARETREANTHRRLSHVLWVVIVVGGIVALVFGAFLPFASPRAHRLANGAVGAMLGLMLFLLLVLGHPLHGAAGVSPAPYREVLHSM